MLAQDTRQSAPPGQHQCRAASPNLLFPVLAQDARQSAPPGQRSRPRAPHRWRAASPNLLFPVLAQDARQPYPQLLSKSAATQGTTIPGRGSELQRTPRAGPSAGRRGACRWRMVALSAKPKSDFDATQDTVDEFLDQCGGAAPATRQGPPTPTVRAMAALSCTDQPAPAVTVATTRPHTGWHSTI